jgi:membrane-bound acyltransferase YfiQ involved in biofilm formation
MLMKMTKTIKMTLAMMVMIKTTMMMKTIKMMIHSYNLNHPSKQNSCLKNTDILLYIDTDVTFS